MPSGERIQFGPNVNFLFESHDLSCASPATISRMGMIFLRYVTLIHHSMCTLLCDFLRTMCVSLYIDFHSFHSGTISMRSDEDTDIKALVLAWLKATPSSAQDQEHARLEGWLEDYFYSSLSWVMKANDFVIDTTLVGVALNGLSHLVGVSCKAEFVCALSRGLGGNLQPATREAFTKDLFQRAHEVAPDSRRLLDTFYDRTSGRLSTHQLEVCGEGILYFCNNRFFYNHNIFFK